MGVLGRERQNSTSELHWGLPLEWPRVSCTFYRRIMSAGVCGKYTSRETEAAKLVNHMTQMRCSKQVWSLDSFVSEYC